MTNPMAVAATPVGVMYSGINYLMDNPGDLAGAGRAAFNTARTAPFAQSVSQVPGPTTPLEQHGIQVPLAANLALNLMGDPTNLVGGGEPAGAHLAEAGMLLGPKALSLIKDLTGPAAERAAQAMATRWPRMTRALTRAGMTGGELTLRDAGRPALALDRAANEIHAATQRAGVNSGATFHPMSGEMQIGGESEGFMVGKYSNQSGTTMAVPTQDFSPKHVRQFIEQNAKTYADHPELAVGTWNDPDGNTYLDVSQNISDPRKATLKATYQKQPAGTARQFPPGVDPKVGQWPKPQNAIYDLAEDRPRPVGNLHEFLNSPEFQQRLDAMLPVGAKVMNGEDWWKLYGTVLEEVYGKERIKPLAGFLASTSPASQPVHNLRAASEYLRRLIMDEPIIQPEFRIPETAVGWKKGYMGGSGPDVGGGFNSPGTLMPMEDSRKGNLQKVAAGQYDKLQEDKVNDMFHALVGEDIGVYDRHYAKTAEDWANGVYAETTPNKLQGSMVSGDVGSYAMVENAVRDGAKRNNMPLRQYSAYVWEGIRDTIKRTGELFGMKFPAGAIPDEAGGFAKLFNDMIAEKAADWGVTVPEFKWLLRNGHAELLTSVLSTGAGMAAYQQWQRVAQGTDSSSGPPPPPPSTSRTPPRPPRSGTSTPG